MAITSKKLALLVGGIALGLGSIVQAADAPAPALVSGASAEVLANTCAGCHGTGGVSAGPASPTLAGTNAEYFNDIMKRYQDGTAYSTIMGRIAKGYTEEEIALMAEYFVKAPFAPAKQSFDEALAKDGAKIHDKVCEKCHSEGGKVLAGAPADEGKKAKAKAKDEDDDGDDGEEVGDEWHILAGQWTPYLHYTIEDYLEKRREMPKKMAKAFQKAEKKGGDTAIAALLAYYASQQ
jgi:sulfide dehydrogenase cytochrome subunit